MLTRSSLLALGLCACLSADPALARRNTVGAPSPRRHGVTGQPLTRVAALPSGFRVEPQGTHGFRLVRESYVALPAWPDTLIVHWFDEVVDEEIALERGEVDAAMFQPGEMSSRLRETPRWHDYRRGVRSRGAIAYVVLNRPPTFNDSVGVAGLNSHLYRGDLVSRVESKSDSVLAARASHTSLAVFATPFYLDAPVEPVDSLGIALAAALRGPLLMGRMSATADSLERSIRLSTRPPEPPGVAIARWSALGAVGIFTLGCPVAVAPERRTEIEALGLGTLVDLMGSLPASGE